MKINIEEVTMSHYMRAYEAGIKLAQLEWRDKLANPQEVPTDFAERVDNVRSEVEGRQGVPGTIEGMDELDGATLDADYLNIPKYVESQNFNDTERTVRVPTSYYPRGMNRADAVAGRTDDATDEHNRMAGSNSYVNPLLLGHEMAHRYQPDGMSEAQSEAEADAYAALSNYDMYDMADMYNQLSRGGDLPQRSPNDSHLSDQDRLSLFAAMMPNQGRAEQAGPPERMDYERAMSRNYIPEGTEPSYYDRASNFFTQDIPGYFSSLSDGVANTSRDLYNSAESAFNSAREGASDLFSNPGEAGDTYTRVMNNTPTNIGGSDFYPNNDRGQTSSNPRPAEASLLDRINAARPPAPRQPTATNRASEIAGPPAPKQPTATNRASEIAGPPAPNRFSAVRGGYAAQLAALRNQAGLSKDDRQFLQGANYRQLAGAMGNRGLRVGDSFDANSLIQRMRMRQANQDQPGAMSGLSMPKIDIQNSRGRDVTRGAMPATRPAQAPANVNPSTGGQFAPSTSPSNFKMPMMTQLTRTPDMVGNQRLPMVGGR